LKCRGAIRLEVEMKRLSPMMAVSGCNVDRPDGAPGQQLKLIVALLFPR
jgi:hypothetical protein